MKPIKEPVVGAKGIKLIAATWLPDGPPRAALILVHGYGEHMGRYKHVVAALTARGYAVAMLDHRGHGASAGVRCHVEQFSYFVDDLRLLVQRERALRPRLPVVMIGHSMGGLIAVHYALRYQSELAGLITSGPALAFGDDVSPLLKRLSGIIARVAPRLEVTPASRAAESVLSRDPLVQEAFDNDPLCYSGRVRARMGHEMLVASVQARARLHELTLPLLVMYGSDDTLVNPRGAILLHDQARSTDKTIRRWDGLRHEIFNEPEQNDVLAELIDWLDARVPQPHAVAV